MDLSAFLQKDITAFLDRTAEQMHRESPSAVRSEEFSVFNEDRDYAKETETAITENNLTKAKEVFDDLRNAFNHHSTNDEEREKIYTILQEVYGKIAAALNAQPFALQGELAQFTQKSLNEHIQAAVAQGGAEDAAFEAEAKAEEAKRLALEADLKTKQATMSTAIDKRDLTAAMTAYRELKDAFTAYPSEDKFRKIEWYNNVLTAYEMTRRLKEELQAKREEEEQALEEAKKKREARKQQAATTEQQDPERKKQLQDIKALIKTLIDELEDGDPAKAEKLLMDARQAVSSLEDEAKEKTPLETILSAITDRLNFYKQHPQAKDAEQEATGQGDEEAADRHHFEETGRLRQAMSEDPREAGGATRP